MKKIYMKMATYIVIASMLIIVVGCSNTTIINNDTSEETLDVDEAKETLTIGESEFSEKFSPLFVNSISDLNVSDMTQLYLVQSDRSGQIIYNGIEGETKEYQGTQYEYYGPADIKVDRKDNETVYDISLKTDLKFSDGESVTADDLIFALYAFCDIDYDGSNTLSSQPIKGLKNYRANSTVADDISESEVDKYIDKMPSKLAKWIKNNIIIKTLQEEKDFAEQNYESYGYKDAISLFVHTYNRNKKYKASTDFDKVIKDISEQYSACDYRKFANIYSGDDTYFDDDVYNEATAQIIGRMKQKGNGQDVDNISGIKKINDYEVTITTQGYETSVIYQLELPVIPLHYYGDTSLYDYANNKFGFTRGDLSALREKSNVPVGAGPYTYVRYDGNTVYMEANQYYYLGKPETEYIQMKGVAEDEKLSCLEDGEIDVVDVDLGKNALASILSENSNKKLKGDKLTSYVYDCRGYGYIGINAKNVCVDNKTGSEKSKNLRKALATVLSVYRDIGISTYYGDSASIINYPISDIIWASPKSTDEDYEIAYSKDVDGNDIYDETMSSKERYKASLDAALTFFEAAGYTVRGGKVVKAPKGAALEYNIIVPAEGGKDYPTYTLVKDAAKALKTIGITLSVTNPSDNSMLWSEVESGSQQLWCAAWQSNEDLDLYQTYYSTNVVSGSGTENNFYDITDDKLDSLIIDSRSNTDRDKLRSIYKQCFDEILDWAVEVPVYQRKYASVFSTERIDTSSICEDISPFYSWSREVQNIRLN